MQKIKGLLSLAMLFAGMSALAQTTDGVIVSSGDTEHRFAISEIKEITFGDDGMTVVKTDEATVEFSGDWLISFGEVDVTGITLAEASGKDAKAQVFDANGVLVK